MATLEDPVGDGLRKRATSPSEGSDKEAKLTSIPEKEPKMMSIPEKEAYFKMLRLWVNYALLHQSASQCFPDLFMAQNPPAPAPGRVQVDESTSGS